MPSTRVPLDLQAVFVASSCGEEVHKPPTSRSAFKVFLNVVGVFKRRSRGRTKKSLSRTLSIGSCSTFPSANSVSDDISVGVPEDPTSLTPQHFVEGMLRKRGYNVKRNNAVASAYFNEPTQLQLASYNTRSIELCTKKFEEHELRELLSCGVSLNACNIHGETLMHKACRLGLHQVLSVFLEFDPELKICDAQGRTLLHDACWGPRPSFQTFSLLLQHEPELLFMADCRGACPLDYVQNEYKPFWVDYIQCHADKFWPPLLETPPEPASMKEAPHSRPVPDPFNALSCDLAHMVTTGRMKPKEVFILLSCQDEATDPSCFSGSCSFSSDDFDFDQSEISMMSEEDRDLLEELGAYLGAK